MKAEPMVSKSDIHLLWQEQAREEQPMPLSDIRMKALHLDNKTRRWNAISAVSIVLLLILETWQVWINEELLERVGDALTIAALLYIAYRYHRHHRASPPAALGSTNGVEFYRAELVRQRDLAGDNWGYLLPFVPGVTLSLVGGALQERPASHVIALAVFGVALFLGVAWLNAYTARKLQRDIDALDAS
jgi:hypothetical protein